MRKRIIPRVLNETLSSGPQWLKIEELADVEITSEDPAHAIESALGSDGGPGWRAAGSGHQTIRIIFSAPQRLGRIWLDFLETREERTQEFVLRWSPDGGRSFHEIIRQQWNFSPGGSTRETADLNVDLPGVTILELYIIPDKNEGSAVASLAAFRLA